MAGPLCQAVNKRLFGQGFTESPDMPRNMEQDQDQDRTPTPPPRRRRRRRQQGALEQIFIFFSFPPLPPPPYGRKGGLTNERQGSGHVI